MKIINIMLVSVVVATRRRPKYLSTLLKTLCLQSLPPEEVVIVENDTESCIQEVLAFYGEKLPIKHVMEPKAGVCFARNTGVKEASGEIIAFIDDDCEATPTWLENIVKPLKEDESIAGVGGFIDSYLIGSSLAEKYAVLENLLDQYGPAENDN
jgi:glycosyltransferase involved in cell wall biosynthesis